MKNDHKEFYFFNKEKIQYEKEPRNLIYYLRTYWVLGLGTVIFATLFITLFIRFAPDNSGEAVEQDNLQMEKQIAENEKAITQLKTMLDSLEEKNKVIYRLILDAEYEEDTSNSMQDSTALKEDSSWEDIENEIKKLREKLQDQTDNQSMMYLLATVKKGEMQRIPAIRPIRSEVISGFGKKKHPIQKVEYEHKGIDFKADVGSDVVATGDGYVMEVGQNPNHAEGIYIVINHGFGYTTKYAHLSKVLVPRFAQVKRGQVIAKSGKTGICKGPHLHYEVHKNYKPVNPIDYFFSDISTDDYVKIKKQNEVVNEAMD